LDAGSFDINGSGISPVRCSVLEHDEAPSRLAVVFPGLHHTVDRPDLHYIQRCLFEAGADVLRVESQYWRPEYATLTSADQDECVSADARAALDAVFERRGYTDLTLVGKSLGCAAVAHVLDDPRCVGARCIWETPLLGRPQLVARIRRHRPPSLFVVGTADPHFDGALLDELERAIGAQSVRIPRAGHDLEVPGDLEATLDGLHRILGAVELFIA
jgi:dienelactone hydrolase